MFLVFCLFKSSVALYKCFQYFVFSKKQCSLLQKIFPQRILHKMISKKAVELSTDRTLTQQFLKIVSQRILHNVISGKTVEISTDKI